MSSTSDPRESLDLSGSWELVFDPNDEGVAQGWMSGDWPARDAGPVHVPAVWNLTHPDAAGVGFYRRMLTLPSEWAGKALELHFEGASYRAEAWLNGVYLGSHEGAYLPFAFDLASAGRAGEENELVVRVAGLSRTGEVDGMALQHAPASKQSWYYAYGGLWGRVRLESRPWVSLRSVTVEPDLQRESAMAELAFLNRLHECRRLNLRLRVVDPGGSLAFEQSSTVAVPPGSTRFAYRIDLPRPWAWSCEAPHLYRLEAEIGDAGALVDRVTATFGMRDFTVSDGQFFLNGEPIFLRGVLLQPNYPVNLVTPPEPEMMAREIHLVKDAGFNLIRAHLRPTPPGYLDLTDRMGMLVYAEPSLAWIRDSPRITDHGRREVQALIERDRNHPSVVIWGIYNENPTSDALNGEALVRWARALDPTRVIVEDSGGSLAIDQDFGWIDRATVLANRETAREKILDLHLYLGEFLTSAVYEWVRTLGTARPSAAMASTDFGSAAVFGELDREMHEHRGRVFVSELGCAGMMDLDEALARFGGRLDLLDSRELKAFRDGLHRGFDERRLDRVIGSVRNLSSAAQDLQAAAAKRQIEAVLSNPRASGYVLTQLNDVSYEFHAGVLDLWRNPKSAYYAVQQVNRPHCVILKAGSPVVATGERVEVACTLVNRVPLASGGQITLNVYDPEGMEVDARVIEAPIGTGVRELGRVSFETGGASGQYRVSARLAAGPGTLAETAEHVLALPPVNWDGALDDIAWLGTPPELPESGAPVRAAAGEARLLMAAAPGSLVEEDWRGLLDAVEAGRTAIVGPLHKRNELAVRALAGRGVNLALHMGIGSWLGCYHWLPASELFAGLPAGGLAGEAYVDVLPWYVMTEQGGEVFAGSLTNTQSRQEAPAILWYSDIEAVRLGKGALFFCQYRTFEHMADNPVAGRLAHNLIRFARGYPGPRSRID